MRRPIFSALAKHRAEHNCLGCLPEQVVNQTDTRVDQNFEMCFRLLITFLFEYARPCMNIPTRIHKRTKPAITSLDYSLSLPAKSESCMNTGFSENPALPFWSICR